MTFRIEKLRPIQTWKQVQWQLPLYGTIKVNTDGSYIKESGKSGIGGIIKDGNGDCIIDFSMPVICDSNNMAEALAAKFGGKWCNQLGFTNFALELDSTVIVNMINQRGTKNMKLKMVVERNLKVIHNASATVQHCYRENK
ncbi:uncharacterized protein LOC142177329 [Nicotiana tabacum]|uniref:Uncharacterized protein LOC142177329 n=1 Tax=Nicotiana tabacum TaxID=4097 RepID=A0AC58TXH1_TOBAC